MNHSRTTLLHAIAAALAFLSTTALAYYTQTVDGIEWTYTVSDGAASVGGGSSTRAVPWDTTGAIVIPSTLGGYPVTSIRDYAFYGCSGLTSVTIPDSVTSIQGWAFRECSNLTNVTIGDSVKWIGDYAFGQCSGLTSLKIPDSVTHIDHSAFYGCSGLYDTNTIPGVRLVDGWAVGWTDSLLGAVDFTGIRGFANYAFSNCEGLTSITIPDSVTSIGIYAFQSCSGLTSVTIPASVTTIGGNAFFGCRGLTNVTIPDSVTSIGSYAFSGCSGLTNVTIGNSVTDIGSYAFSGCSGLTSVTIPDSVTSIDYYAFSGCNGLTSVRIPESLVDLKTTAFENCTKLWTAWYRTLANLSANGGSSGGGSSVPVAQTVSLTVTNVIVHYVTPSLPSGAVTPDTASAGIVNIVAEVTANKAVAISPEWADQYPDFATTFGTDFSAALTKPNGKRDGAGNPMYVWQDYVAGTDPTDPASVFTASVTFDAETGAPVIGWSPELPPAEAAKRLYTLYGKVRLTDPDWLPIADDPSPYNFFRLTVEMK